MNSKALSLMDKTYKSYMKYLSSGDDIIIYLTPFFINFPKEYLENLSVDVQPSDGVVMNDQYSNVFNLNGIVEWINSNGTLDYNKLQQFSI